MSRRAIWGRWALLLLAIVTPVAAIAAYVCARWGQLALEAVQVVLKLAVIP